MNLIKMLCIKECEAYSSGFFKIKVDEIVDWYADCIINTIPIKEKSEVLFVNENLTLVSIEDFKLSFITLADWRDKQIDKILEE
jgi:hypothetical protein